MSQGAVGDLIEVDTEELGHAHSLIRASDLWSHNPGRAVIRSLMEVTIRSWDHAFQFAMLNERNRVGPLAATLVIELALLLSSGCSGGFANSSPAPANPSSRVRIQGSAFQLKKRSSALVSVIVPFTFTAGDTTVYLERCGLHSEWRLERWVGGHWQFAYAPDCYSVAMAQITVTGREYSDTADAELETNGRSAGGRQLVPGQYRLVLFAFWPMAGMHEFWALSDSLPLAQRASRPFRIQ